MNEFSNKSFEASFRPFSFKFSLSFSIYPFSKNRNFECSEKKEMIRTSFRTNRSKHLFILSPSIYPFSKNRNFECSIELYPKEMIRMRFRTNRSKHPFIFSLSNFLLPSIRFQKIEISNTRSSFTRKR